MPAILIESSPKGIQSLSDPYPLLRRTSMGAAGNGIGKFSLPVEFDSHKFASAFYKEGQEALSMEAEQPLIGTSYTSQGWSVWRYPETLVPTGKLDDKKQPILSKHVMAGQPHKVAGAAPGDNFVLMFRSAEVQEQVNHVYGTLSVEQMTREQTGETLSVEGAGNDPGMLTDQRLKREIGAEEEIERASGRNTSVHQHNPSRHIGQPQHRVSR